MPEFDLNECLSQLVAFEFDWIGVDDEGAVALCQTAGFGDFPDQVLAAGSEHCEASQEFLESLRERLSDRGRARKRWWTKVGEEARDFGARGFYVYDWAHWAGPYRRTVGPSRPLGFDELLTQAPELRAFEDLVVRLPLRFRRGRSFQLPALVPARKPL